MINFNYYTPTRIVFGKDTEAKYDEFVQKLKDAGLDNLIAEWRKQAAEYMAQ